MKYGVIIAAGGKGNRMGLGFNKVLFQLTEKQTVLDKTIEIFKNDPNCDEIIVVLSKKDYKSCIGCMKSGEIVLVSGGQTRCHSVYNGLMAAKSDIVLVHDGARPYLSKEVLERITTAVQKHPAVVPVVPVKDTLKKVINNQVVETLQREEIFQVQTPQAFNTDVLINSYQKAFKADILGTDDAQIVEMYSDIKIHTVEGDYNNTKITTLDDLLKMQ
ncbi:MAG: 2-C-methyl-D-erythritol 4-phosphate cytidylyltransferase [Erysipelotrichaceae bacterium]